MKTLILVGVAAIVGYFLLKYLQPSIGAMSVNPVKTPNPSPQVPSRNICQALTTIGGAAYGQSIGIPAPVGAGVSALASKPICSMGAKLVQGAVAVEHGFVKGTVAVANTGKNTILAIGSTGKKIVGKLNPFSW